MRADKYPEEWGDFIVEMWLSEECTRASENAADEISNPHNKHDKSRYRLHWLEKKLEEVVRIVNEHGKVRFGADFEYKDGIRRPQGFAVSWKCGVCTR